MKEGRIVFKIEDKEERPDNETGREGGRVPKVDDPALRKMTKGQASRLSLAKRQRERREGRPQLANMGDIRKWIKVTPRMVDKGFSSSRMAESGDQMDRDLGT